MARNVRDTLLLAKIEGTYGTDSVPVVGSNAMLISKPSITPLVTNNIDRDLIRGYFGNSEQLVGTRSVECSFTVELAGSGVAETPPAFGPLLRACSLAETIEAATRVDYTPITNDQESVTLYWFDSGVRHVLRGARGTVQIMLKSGERPELAFSFRGLHSNPTAVTPAAADFSLFLTPLAVIDANTGDVTQGGTVASTGAPAISGGTAYPSLGLELDLANEYPFTPLLGGETVDVTDRKLKGKISIDQTPAQEVAQHATVLSAALTSMSLLHGTTAGHRMIVHLPSVQSMNPTKGEINGKRLIEYALNCVPTPGGDGNDEFRLVFF